MPSRFTVHRPPGMQTPQEAKRQRDARRGSAASRGYGARWQAERVVFLAANPLCVRCRAEGRIEAATVVDHVKPHRGDQVLFWDQENWQPLCKPHHDRDKQREERAKR